MATQTIEELRAELEADAIALETMDDGDKDNIFSDITAKKETSWLARQRSFHKFWKWSRKERGGSIKAKIKKARTEKEKIGPGTTF